MNSWLVVCDVVVGASGAGAGVFVGCCLGSDAGGGAGAGGFVVGGAVSVDLMTLLAPGRWVVRFININPVTGRS